MKITENTDKEVVKLMTLGLDEKQAEEEIINGFLK